MEESEFRARAETNQSTDRLRVLLLGSKGVGKTSIVRRFIRDRIVSEYHSSETDQQFIRSDKVTVELIDVNNFLLPSLKKMAIKTADAFVLVYAVDDIYSFESICALKDEIIALKGKNTPIVVAGNKVDVDKREVHPVVADCIVTMDHEYPHVEVSAKEAFELTTLFRILFQHPSLYKKLDKLSGILLEDSIKSSHVSNINTTQAKDLLRRSSIDSRFKSGLSIVAPLRSVFKIFK